MSEIINLLASDNYLVVNRDLIKAFGLECAVYLSEIAREYVYWDRSGKTEDGWFYTTMKVVEENTSLKRYKQEKCMADLIAMGILEAEVRGMPSKKYFRLQESRIKSVLTPSKDATEQQPRMQKSASKDAENCIQGCCLPASKDVAYQHPRMSESSNQGCCSPATNNTKYNNTKINNTDNSTKDKKEECAHLDAEDSMIAERGFSVKMESAIREWLQYKREKRQPYKETGLSNLLSRIQSQVKAHGEDAVIDLIRDSMTNNWQGIIWDRISQRKGTTSPNDTSRISWIDDVIDGWRETG